jgi:3'-phosphoadenosine 5'-phosphosulfate sulfotransferase (PAPS reductase)/FAD synthetase
MDEEFEEPTQRVVCWFSCGVTSAVAAKISLDNPPPDTEVHIVYCDTRSEHPDNRRFLLECEEWFDCEIEIIGSDKYEDVWDVYEKTRFLSSPQGARCTGEMKLKPRKAYQRWNDIHVLGFDSSEQGRVDKFMHNNHDLQTWFPLVEMGLSKRECAERIMREGIEIPEIYRLGYRNANCIGCCKASSMGYWNKIRIDFPDVFERMSKVERNLNVAINKTYKNTGLDEDGKPIRQRVFLDELDPDAGNYETDPVIECGISCGVQGALFGDE